MRIGIVEITSPAKTRGQSETHCPTKLKRVRGIVKFEVPDKYNSGERKSFQIKITLRIRTVDVIGLSRGKTTFQKVKKWLAPSTHAASSYSRGRTLMNPQYKKIENGICSPT